MNHERKLGSELLDRLTVRKAKPGLNMEFKRIKGGLLRTSRFGQSIAVIGGDDAPSVTGRPTEAVAKFYEMHRRNLGLPEDQRILGRPTVLRDRNTEVFCYEPRVKGLKVYGAWVTLGLATQRRSKKNMLIALNSDERLDWLVRGTFRMKATEAVSVATEGYLGFKLSERDAESLLSSNHIRVEKVLAPFRSTLRCAFRVMPVGLKSELLKEKFGSESVEAVVDAENGFIIRTRPIVAQLNCQVSAYDQNPVKSPRNIDRDSLIVDGRSSQITPPSYGSNVLRNEHFDVVPGERGISGFVNERAGRATGAGAHGTDFLYKYNDYPHISEANAFYHLNQVRQMLLRINPTFTNQTTAPQGQRLKVYVDVAASGFDAYSRRDGQLDFLAKDGVGAADDADIVAHEYGHQVHFVLAPNLDRSEIKEAIADFIATIYAHDTSVAELYPNRNLVTSKQILDPDFPIRPYSCLREIYNDYRYPEDYIGLTPVEKSRILSGAFMELHLNFFNEFGDKDYFFVPRSVLNMIPFITADSYLCDVAETYAFMVVSVAIMSDILDFDNEEELVFHALQTLRVFTRRGLI